MVIEIVQYYTENGARPVYILLLDASKALDKVAFNVRNLYFMYTKQSYSVKWDNKQSDYFKISNSVKQGGVISQLIFSCYITYNDHNLYHNGYNILA